MFVCLIFFFFLRLVVLTKPDRSCVSRSHFSFFYLTSISYTGACNQKAGDCEHGRLFLRRYPGCSCSRLETKRKLNHFKKEKVEELLQDIVRVYYSAARDYLGKPLLWTCTSNYRTHLLKQPIRFFFFSLSHLETVKIGWLWLNNPSLLRLQGHTRRSEVASEGSD